MAIGNTNGVPRRHALYVLALYSLRLQSCLQVPYLSIYRFCAFNAGWQAQKKRRELHSAPHAFSVRLRIWCVTYRTNASAPVTRTACQGGVVEWLHFPSMSAWLTFFLLFSLHTVLQAVPPWRVPCCERLHILQGLTGIPFCLAGLYPLRGTPLFCTFSHWMQA